MRIFNSIILMCYISTCCFSLCAQESKCEDIEDRIQKARETGGRTILAHQYKLLGDCYARENAQENALKAYQKALSFPYQALTPRERVEIAEMLQSFGANHLARIELIKILQNDPNNQEAERLLILSNETLQQEKTDKVIAETPIQPTPSLIDEKCGNLLVKIKEAEEQKFKGRLGYLYKQLGDCYMATGGQEEAAKAYEKALSYPYEALYTPVRLEIAENLGNMERYQQSISELDKILERDPVNDRARLLKAQFLSWKGETREAEKNVDLVLEKDPRSIQARLTKANILLDSGREREAIMYYQQLLIQDDLTPKQDFDARYGLSAAYLSLGQISLAENTMRFLQPESPHQEKRKIRLEQQLAYAQSGTSPSSVPSPEIEPAKPAPKFSEEVREPSPKADEKEAILCSEYLENIKKAKLEKRTDTLAVLYKDLGDCYANNQKRNLAADAYEKAFSYPLKELTINKRIEMASFLGYQDRYDPAIAQLKKLLALEPGNKEILILIARFHSWRGEENDQKIAENYIDQVLEKNPKNIEARIIKANVLTYTDRSKDSIGMYQDLLEKKYLLSPEEIFWTRFGLALAYTSQKEYVLAEIQLALIDTEFPYQENKVSQLRKRIAKAKDKIPEEQLAEQKKYLKEKVDRARELLNYRCFNLGMFELYEVLRCDPCHVYARIMQARGLALMGHYCEALREINAVLRIDPRSIDAWIVKGTILRWKQAIPASTCAFLEALRINDDNFDARIGLAWTDLSRGDQTAAYQLAATTSICESYQMEGMQDLSWEIHLGPNFGFDYSRYKDTDDIWTEDYYAEAEGYFKDYKIGLLYHHVYAEQPVSFEPDIDLDQHADAGYLTITKFFNPCFDFGGGVGYAHSSEDDYVLGRAFANYRTDTGNFYLSSSYDIFFPTAAAVFFEIRTWENLISYVNVLSGYWIVGGEYAYTYYTDGNHSNRADFWVDYKLIRCPRWNLTLNYRFRFWDFADQIVSPFVVPGIFGGHGYFDPFDYFGNQLGISFIYTSKCLEILVHPYTAYVTYEEAGRHNGFIYVGDFDLEYHFSKNFSAHIGFEAGTYPLKNLKYRYTLVSAGVDWYF